jgi:shikimate dehydrogenase
LATTTPAAGFSGAVSLVTRDGTGGLVGHMTEGRGIVEAVRGHLDPSGCGAVVLGAGPVARAAALELALAGVASLAIGDPDAARAAALVEAVAGLAATTVAPLDWRAAIELPAGTALVVHAPEAAAGDVACHGLRADLVLADAGLTSRPSAIARQAAAAGACVVDGIEVHAARTAIDFHALTGHEADADMLREALDEFTSA